MTPIEVASEPRSPAVQLRRIETISVSSSGRPLTVSVISSRVTSMPPGASGGRMFAASVEQGLDDLVELVCDGGCASAFTGMGGGLVVSHPLDQSLARAHAANPTMRTGHGPRTACQPVRSS